MPFQYFRKLRYLPYSIGTRTICRSLQDQGKAAYFVADPAKGLVTYSHDDFVGHWMLTHLGGEECGVAMVAGGQPKVVVH